MQSRILKTGTEHLLLNSLKKDRRVLKQFDLFLHLALQNTKKAKLEDIYRAYLIALEELTDGGNRDDSQV